ncbi:hypothetical protein L0664_05115 [Octadecabacter sp. G9-8]|uniref:CTP synthetase n=1 Tax=Octadecabacter dasysiphoniae TaxID=2909341 RepID=A0ABS9CT98_9RHOB|nr:hypothetical protein [Octadecabacter dasysiphoniae]MCF2870440.1 hypothetical protein [Octadecabacter dasysiphoniae]
MKPIQHPTRRYVTALVFGICIAILPVTAQAYVGPGAGLTAIGTMLALFAALILAVVGFVWYPIKRLVGAGKTSAKDPRNDEPRK